jgi:hypothetical protein
MSTDLIHQAMGQALLLGHACFPLLDPNSSTR